MLAIEKIKRAREVIEPVIEHIPMSFAPKLSCLLSTDIYLTRLGANIAQIDLDHTSAKLAYGDAYVIIALETKGEAHEKEIRQELQANRYDFKEIL